MPRGRHVRSADAVQPRTRPAIRARLRDLRSRRAVLRRRLGNDVYRCNSDGTDGTYVEMLPEDNVCSRRQCKTPCEAAEDNPSNVGCDFWAVDLDNEVVEHARHQQRRRRAAVLDRRREQQRLPGRRSASTKNTRERRPADQRADRAPTSSVPPRVAQRVDLPQREVDGAMGQNGMYTPNTRLGHVRVAARLSRRRPGPVVVYQFNPIIQQYSNDASTLIPRPGARQRLHRRRLRDREPVRHRRPARRSTACPITARVTIIAHRGRHARSRSRPRTRSRRRAATRASRSR